MATNNGDIPADKLAEQCLIGSFLLDPDYTATVIKNAGIGSPDLFYSDHSRLLDVLLEAHEDNLPVDHATVGFAAPDLSVLALDCMNSTPSYVNAPQYAERVRKLSQQRKLILLTGMLAEAVYAGDMERVEYLTDQIEAARSTGQGGRFGTWQPTSITDYAAQPLPDKRWLVEQLLPVHGVVMWHGAPGSLKTQLVLDLASCVATGTDWLQPSGPATPHEEGTIPYVDVTGTITFKTAQAKVLFLNFDMSDEEVQERAAALHRTRPLPDGAVLDVISLPVPWLDLSKPATAPELAAWIAKRGYELIVIDNFSNVKGTAKLVDETIADVMRSVRILSKLANCAVWIVHHETKTTASKSALERMYGGVHIAAAIEAAFSVTRSGDYVQLEASKQRGHMIATVFQAKHVCAQRDGGRLDTFLFVAASADEIEQESGGTAAPNKTRAAEDWIVRRCMQEPGRLFTKGDLWLLAEDEVEFKERTFSRALTAAADSGRLESDRNMIQRGGIAKYWWVDRAR